MNSVSDPGTDSLVVKTAEMGTDNLGMDWGPPDLVTMVNVYFRKGRSRPMEMELVSVEFWIRTSGSLRSKKTPFFQLVILCAHKFVSNT